MEIIKLEKICNTRDLGGMKSADGRTIKPNKLIRTSALSGISESDAKVLAKHNIGKIIDFRTAREVEEHPESLDLLQGVKYHHLPAIIDIETSLSRDKKTRDQMMSSSKLKTKEGAIESMSKFYALLPGLDSAKEAYSKFVEILLKNEEDKAVAWHCSLGKDRAGLAAILIEYLLGIPKQDILDDYLLTNKLIAPLVDIYIKEFKKLYGTNIDIEPFKMLQSARMEYLKSTYDAILKQSGSLDNYITEELGITKDAKEQLKRMYLE